MAAHAATCPAGEPPLPAGADLREPPELAASNHLLDLDLTAERPATPVAIGDLSVSGVPVLRGVAHGATPCGPANAYRGQIWHLDQGDLLRLHVTSRLDFTREELPPPRGGGVSCQAANIHAHGLEVSPYKRKRPDGTTVYGDYVLDVAVPVGDGCTDTMGMGGQPAMLHEIAIPAHHPAGLFWYHPHPHGYTGALLSGATTGAITVGRADTYMHARTLLLKDAELLPHDGGWHLQYARDRDLEDDCAKAGTAKGAQRPGQCDDWRKHRWLFTINGQRDPRIAASTPELWRIVNASPNVTYRLRITPRDDPQGTPLPFTLVSLAGPESSTAPAEARELLLMPGMRAEITITPPATGGDYALTQMGFASGGDSWPAMRLAAIAFTPGAPAASLAARAVPASPGAPERYYTQGPSDPCGFAPTLIRHIHFVQRPTFTDDRRRQQLYGILSTLADGNGTETLSGGKPFTRESWRALLDADPAAPAFMHNPDGAICTYLGHSEIWVLENDTDEDHDFHIHQGSFQLDDAHAADPRFFSAPPPAPRDALLATSDASITASEAPLPQDTVPVPRGTRLGGRGCDGSPMNPDCRAGRISIVVRFDRDEQIGEFVYHCHIAQHEDGGMMAEIRVKCPPGDGVCAAAHSE